MYRKGVSTIYKEIKESATPFFKHHKSIKEADWELLTRNILKLGVKTVLEFGSGISTAMWSLCGCDVCSFETNMDYMIQVQDWCKDNEWKVTFVPWDNEHFPYEGEMWDLGFCDGIWGRKRSLEICRDTCKYIALHDKPRVKEMVEGLRLIAHNTKTVLYENMNDSRVGV